MSGQELDLIKILLESSIVVKAVLVILILCSVGSWAIVLNRRSFFAGLDRKNKNFLATFRGADVLTMNIARDDASCFDEMLFEGREELSKIQSSLKEGGTLAEYLQAIGVEPLERSLKKGSLAVTLKAEKHLATLASIASVSPFIGLFGTVWGIINSFQGLAGGGMTLAKVAPGIAEALVATAVGLAAAIPAGWFYNKYSNKMGELNNQMEQFAMDFLNEVLRKSMSK
jgi:biopolymer transport protein TolQ